YPTTGRRRSSVMVPLVKNTLRARWVRLVWAAALGWVLLLGGNSPCRAQDRASAPLAIFKENLPSGWEDWSWASPSLASTGHVHSGQYAIQMTPESWNGLYFHHDPVGTS